MTYHISHIHLRSTDPVGSAQWFSKAFGMTITNDMVRPEPFGDRFVRCVSADGGMALNISGPRIGETLGPADWGPHHGLEHFAVESEDVAADVARLQELGAELLEGPMASGPTVIFAYIKTPDGVRVELLQPVRREAGAPG